MNPLSSFLNFNDQNMFNQQSLRQPGQPMYGGGLNPNSMPTGIGGGLNPNGTPYNFDGKVDQDNDQDDNKNQQSFMGINGSPYQGNFGGNNNWWNNQQQFNPQYQNQWNQNQFGQNLGQYSNLLNMFHQYFGNKPY